jgi:thiol-disulfide isomerase/thioredoxin
MSAHRALLTALMVSGSGVRIEALAQGGPTMQPSSPAAAQLPVEGDLPSLSGATLWLHSQPLTREALRGKVVLVQFGTYTCIYWRRTLPYIRAWAERYAGQGLVVLVVHTPEFEFERDLDNVRRAVKEIGLDLPIAVDSDRAIWRAFENEYWPALYVVDAQGHVRYHHFGEGDYERSERVIQQLLAEAGHAGAGGPPVTVEGRGAEAPADLADLRSPETYLGYGQAERFVGRGGARRDEPHRYAAPGRLGLNEWALEGDWTVREHAAAADEPRGRVAYRFHARDVHLIMGPARRGASVRFRVLIDGRPPGPAHGLDVDEEGHGTVTEQRTYQLLRQPGPIVDRTFEIEFTDPGVEAFDFTFG